MQIIADPQLVAACGLYCGSCRSYLKGRCPGCRKNTKATWCKVRSCNHANGFSTCAECKEFSHPMLCKKYNNPISKVFGFLLRSDRSACISQIQRLGLEGHAKNMSESKRHTIRKIR